MAIYVNKNIPMDIAVKIACKKLAKESEGIIKELRKREYAMSKGQKKREKSKLAQKEKRKLDRKKAAMQRDVR